MKTNAAGIALIKRFEECRLQAYLPTPNDKPTIGWGHTRGVVLGQKCTQAQADDWLANDDIVEAERIVNENIDFQLNPNQFSALVSFVFNIGPGKPGEKDGFVYLKNGRHSTIMRKVNAREFEEAADEFHKWCHQNGEVLNGLVRRRQAEEELFLRPAPKPLRKSRTVAAQTVSVASSATVATGGTVAALKEVQEQVVQLSPFFTWAIVAAGIIGVGMAVWTLYARWDDSRKARR